VNALPRQSWVDAEPAIVERERRAMTQRCPEMTWRDKLQWPDGRIGAGWEGLAPAWGADREQPSGVDELLNGRRLSLRVLYPEAFPMTAPDLYPIEPEVPLDRRTEHRWHVNGDGSLCLMQAADDWQPTDTAADLVCKASGWFIEYLLVDDGALDAMETRGIYVNTSLDALLAARFA
jgi:hypothetical protein